MQISLICLQDTKSKALIDLENKYIQRLNSLSKLKIINAYSKKFNVTDTKKRQNLEENELFKHLKQNSKLVILDEKAKLYTSKDFSDFLKFRFEEGKEVIFAIGGPFGWTDTVRDKADYKLSLSSLTFTAEMARLVFVEQFYRGVCILNNHPYHKA